MATSNKAESGMSSGKKWFIFLAIVCSAIVAYWMIVPETRPIWFSQLTGAWECPAFNSEDPFELESDSMFIDGFTLADAAENTRVKMNLYFGNNTFINSLYIRSDFVTDDRKQMGRKVGFWHNRLAPPIVFGEIKELHESWGGSIGDFGHDHILNSISNKLGSTMPGLSMNGRENWDSANNLFNEAYNALKNNWEIKLKVGEIQFAPTSHQKSNAYSQLSKWRSWIEQDCFRGIYSFPS